MNKTPIAANCWVKDSPSPYQLHDFTHFPDWRKLIVFDAYFNNLAAGLMLVSTLLWWAGPSMCGFILPVAMTVALVIVLFDLCLLVADLGDPWRFIHSLRVMRLCSPLSIGVWGLVSFSAFLGAGVILQWISLAVGSVFFLDMLAKLFTVMASFGAIVVICYKGVVFSCSSQPGVRQARWLTAFMITDALLMGMALYLFIALCSGAGRETLAIILPLIFLLVARCTTFALLWQEVKPRAVKVYKGENRTIGWAVFMVGGLLPLLLPLCGMWGLVLAIFLIMACGIFERAWIIGLARPI